MIRYRLCLGWVCLAAIAGIGSAQEIEVDPEPKGFVSGLYGEVRILDPESPEPRVLADSDPVFEGSRITASEDAYAEISLLDGSELTVDELTQLDLSRMSVSSDAAEPDRLVDLSMLYGSLRLSVPQGFSGLSVYKVTTPVAVAGVRGTDFAVDYESEDQVTVDVFEGEVGVGRTEPVESVVEGEAASASAGGGVSKSGIQEHRREKWEQSQSAIHLRRQEQSLSKLKEHIEIVRAQNPDDPRLAGLENAAQNVAKNREEAHSRFSEAREKMKDHRGRRVERMRDFAQKHGKDKFDHARRFRGGALSPENRQKAGQKLRNQREQIRGKAQERRNNKKDQIRPRRDDRKDTLKDRRENRQDKMRERQGPGGRERRGGEDRRDNRRDNRQDQKHRRR